MPIAIVVSTSIAPIAVSGGSGVIRRSSCEVASARPALGLVGSGRGLARVARRRQAARQLASKVVDPSGQWLQGGCSFAPPCARLTLVFAFEQRVDAKVCEVPLANASGVDAVFPAVFVAAHKGEANKRGKCGDSGDDV